MTIRQAAEVRGFLAIRRQFQFRSIEIGRWVSPQERDRAASRFQRALADLMQILGVPEAVVSLRGSLGLQYGIGGRPGVAAHYLPGSRKLALAKNAGAGSLAHEWFHAFDHYMGTRLLVTDSPSLFASAAWLDDIPLRPHPLNDKLARCFAQVMLSADGSGPSGLFSRSHLADKRLGTLYYARPEELCARAFEAFVEDAMPGSRFLVQGSCRSAEADAGLYPKGPERAAIAACFADFFASLGAAVGKERLS